MQPPIDLTQSFRREMQQRQRQKITTSLLNAFAWLGIIFWGSLFIFLLGWIVLNCSPRLILIPVAVMGLPAWGLWAGDRLFKK